MPNSYFTFDGHDSRDLWDCYKTDPINFPTPERDTEVIEVPGRNGDIILDNGNYKNVEIVASCHIDSDFLNNFDKMRAYLMRDADYHRLWDSVYPDEYRMVSVRNVEAKIATPSGGTVEITMTCKPQRFLIAGEQATTLTGTGHTSMIVAEGLMKDIMSAQYVTHTGLPYPNDMVTVIDVGTSGVNNSDIFCTYDNEKIGGRMVKGTSDDSPTTSSYTGGVTGRTLIYQNRMQASPSYYQYTYFTTPDNWEVYLNGDDTLTSTLYPDESIICNPTLCNAAPLIKIHTGGTAVSNRAVCLIGDGGTIRLNSPASITRNTLSITVNDIYIDCEAMNAYMPYGSDVINMNQYVSLPEKAITLKPGNNVIRFNDWVGYIEIVPRWWKI